MSTPIIVIGVVLLLLVGFVIMTYNQLVKLSQKVKESFATMDVYLKKRFDLVPNLVETVKGYAKHERETLDKVTQARANISSAGSIDEKMQNENILSGCLKSLFAVAEAYPDLKANTNFIDLQNQLKKIEEDIANARKYYNAVVREYNTTLLVFPKNIIANMFHFTEKPMYEVDQAAEREAVKVSFE